MGLEIKQESFSEEEYQAFSKRLYECLSALKNQLSKPDFGQGPLKIGAELENYIVDHSGEVLPLNKEIIEKANNKNFTVELNKFNLEINLDPIRVSPGTFSRLESAMNTQLNALRHSAEALGALIVPTGILPTLREEHLTREYMTDYTRYHVLSKQLYAMRGEDFKVNISGENNLQLSCDHVALEGANTSFQFHLMVRPGEFADMFNAIQLITSLVVAVSANSPILLNKILWDETRIALFKQSIDNRIRHTLNWRQPSRVSFGHGWVRDNAWELFSETVALYPPIFPVISNEHPLEVMAKGETPKLEELSLHMGSTWPWNRAVYSSSDGGHVRIEMRSLPAGPSITDMCANAAFAMGLAFGLKQNIRDLLAVIPFRFAEYNFYRAAQHGLDAEIIWTNPKIHRPVEMPIIEVLQNMLPVAESGLKTMGIAEREIRNYLSIIEGRLTKKITGARWQKCALKYFEQHQDRYQACKTLMNTYMNLQNTGVSVCEWDFPK